MNEMSDVRRWTTSEVAACLSGDWYESGDYDAEVARLTAENERLRAAVVLWDAKEGDHPAVHLLAENERLTAELAEAKRLTKTELMPAIDAVVAERDQWQERHRREHEAHAANLKEWKKCETERDALEMQNDTFRRGAAGVPALIIELDALRAALERLSVRQGGDCACWAIARKALRGAVQPTQRPSANLEFPAANLCDCPTVGIQCNQSQILHKDDCPYRYPDNSPERP